MSEQETMKSEVRYFSGCNKKLSIDGFVACAFDSMVQVQDHCKWMKENNDECNACTLKPIRATIEYRIKTEAVE